MNLHEVLTMGGFGSMVQPGTQINQQVVQPRTIQADNPEQSGEGYEKLKNSQKDQKEIEVEIYNAKDVDHIKNPYKNPEELEKKLKKTVFAIDNKEIASMDDGWEKFAANVGKATGNRPGTKMPILKPSTPRHTNY